MYHLLSQKYIFLHDIKLKKNNIEYFHRRL